MRTAGLWKGGTPWSAQPLVVSIEVGPGQHIYCIFVRAAETMPGCCSAPQALLIRKHHATVANLQFSEAFDVSPLLSNTTVSRILF